MAHLPVKTKDILSGASLSYFVRTINRKTRLTNRLLTTGYHLRNLLGIMIGINGEKKENKSIFSYATKQ